MERHRVRLVDGMFYQDAIATLAEGAPVTLVADPDNPRGERTVKATTAAGETVGYLEDESWLARAMLDRRMPVAARVHHVIGRQMRLPVHGLVLEVVTGDDALKVLGKAIAPAATPDLAVMRGGSLLDRHAGLLAAAVLLLGGLAYYYVAR